MVNKCVFCDKKINALNGTKIYHQPCHVDCYKKEIIRLERKRLAKKIKKWDVEACCHGIMQKDLLRELGEEDWIKY